jgi:3-oxoacyl-[acyl-carrier protein] reductase
MKLDGKRALVFGGSSGIGRATAELFAREGATVAVIGGSDLAKPAEVVDGIIRAGGRASAHVADIQDIAAIRRVVTEVEQAGGIDILVNSAGVYYPTPLGGTAEEDFDRMVGINLKGTFFAIDAVAPGMKQRRSGSIVNVASVAAFRASIRYPLYSAVKAGVVMLTKSFAADLAPFCIHVNAIAPGNTATPLNVDDRLGPDAGTILAAKKAGTPSARLYSPPEEMAAACLFLACGDVKAMYGTTLLLDEGLSTLA